MTNEEEIYLQRSLSPDTLQLILMPTEQCNFRCTYCYEDFSIGRMQPNTVSALKKFMAHRIKGLRALSVEWFGGEPLAARDIVVDLSEYANRICRENNVYLQGSATTNGYFLSTELACNLAQLGFNSYQITLDGDSDAHDRTRVLASGAPTFTRIWGNLLALRKSEIQARVKLRLHLAPDNYESMKRLVMMLREELLHDHRFSVIFRQIENLGGPNTRNINPITKKQATERTRELMSLAYPEAAVVPPPPKPPLLLCYASRPNAFIVRATGDIAKCTVAFGLPGNRVGKLESDGAINLDKNKMQDWMRGFVSHDPSELHCPAQHFPSSKSKIIPIKEVL